MKKKEEPHIETEKEFHEAEDAMVEGIIEEEEALAALKKLKEKLKKSEAERMDYLTGWQKAKADLINARKRDEADRHEFTKFANERLIESLIPALDSFDMAMANKDAWERVDKNWRVGVEYIYSQLRKALSENGLEEIDPLHKKFDHSLHEAVEYVPVDDEKLDHHVTHVIQRGYRLNGKVLKPARVKVGEFKKA